MSEEVNEHFTERRHTLTAGDLQAIQELLESVHECKFSSEERVDIKRNVKRINTLANAIGWAVIAIIGAGLLYLFKLGVIAKGQ
jgi:hypothetical protein